MTGRNGHISHRGGTVDGGVINLPCCGKALVKGEDYQWLSEASIMRSPRTRL
jgi:hypothetical protein